MLLPDKFTRCHIRSFKPHYGAQNDHCLTTINIYSEKELHKIFRNIIRKGYTLETFFFNYEDYISRVDLPLDLPLDTSYDYMFQFVIKTMYEHVDKHIPNDNTISESIELSI